MSESAMRQNLVATLNGLGLHAQAIESPSTGIGIPDVNFLYGWIECKMLPEWPKKADTNPVRFPHPLSKEQGIWLWKRSVAGGLALCCCQVARSWFFFDGMTIKDRWAQMTRPQMIEEALFYSQAGLDKERLGEWLRSTN